MMVSPVGKTHAHAVRTPLPLAQDSHAYAYAAACRRAAGTTRAQSTTHTAAGFMPSKTTQVGTADKTAITGQRISVRLTHD